MIGHCSHLRENDIIHLYGEVCYRCEDQDLQMNQNVMTALNSLNI